MSIQERGATIVKIEKNNSPSLSISFSALLIIFFLASWVTGCSFATIPISPPEAVGMRSMRLSSGESIYYRKMGEHGGATPVLLIHGIPDSSESWVPIMKQLSKTHSVYAVDLAGYGYSEWSDNHNFSLSAQANYLREFMEQLSLERAILVGHDIGGGIAQILTVRQPHRISHLVLVNSAMADEWPALEVRMLRTPIIGISTFTVLENPIWSYMLRKGFADREKITPEVRQKYQQWFQGADGRKRLVRNARVLDNTDLTRIESDVVKLPVSTLILWGRHDRFLPATSAQRICGLMPNCRFQYIERAGHFVLDEQPDEIADHILRFIQ
jgi:pimeloyl-ACP methyl ester carboxylesterase